MVQGLFIQIVQMSVPHATLRCTGNSRYHEMLARLKKIRCNLKFVVPKFTL
jgi:hypothetical protein